MNRRDLRFLLAALAALIAISGTQPALLASTPSPEVETTFIPLSLEASGLRTAQKIDEESCAFGFPLLVDDPVIAVFSENDTPVSVQPLGTGERLAKGGSYHCAQSYQIEVPLDSGFRLEIAPYFVEKYSPRENDQDGITIVIHRNENDPFPISPLPTGGPIDGTNNISIVGRFELRGNHFEHFINMPIIGCMGGRGYDDIMAGMQITVKDATGTIIGISELIPDPTEDLSERCQFYFVVEVPESTFYTFESGRRGGITFSHDDIVENDYGVSLTLGR